MIINVIIVLFASKIVSCSGLVSGFYTVSYFVVWKQTVKQNVNM